MAPGFALALSAVPRPIAAPPPSDKVERALLDRLHPQDVFGRVFHPPRA
jgi:hypothetical protein